MLRISLFFALSLVASSSASAQSPGPAPVANGQIQGYSAIDVEVGVRLPVEYVASKNQYCVNKPIFSDSRLGERACLTREEWMKEGYSIGGS